MNVTKLTEVLYNRYNDCVNYESTCYINFIGLYKHDNREMF